MNAPVHWMKQRWRSLPLACLLLAVLLGAIYARSLGYDSKDYFANVALLRQVGQLDPHWELDAVKTRIGQNPNYDALASPLEALHELPLQIEASPPLAAALIYADNPSDGSRADLERELAGLADSRDRIDLAYLKEDIPARVAESRDGMQRVGKIVQDLKQFSRVEASQEWERADLRRGLQSTLSLIGSDLDAVAEVQTEFGPMLEIECMPSQLNQVFLHLLQNAAQAIGPERGRVTVRCGSEGAEVWVEISDTGAGIAAEALPRIFAPFYTTRPIGKGTGLGLSLSCGIVQNHYGRIDVQSTPGRGSTFRVTLPVSHRMAEA